MSSATHLRFEILRTYRNRRFIVLTLALPLVLFYVVASSERDAHVEGMAFPLYFMTGMAAYGSLWAVFSPGARIATDRAKGWTRQVRITPLRTETYFIAKVLVAYLVALPVLLVLDLAGTSLGVRLSAVEWLEMTGLLLVGLTPFVVMGVIVGHTVAADSLAPALGGLVVLFALFGGAFGQFFTGGTMLSVVQLLPSYWLVQASKAAIAGGGWPIEGWLVIAVWTVAMIALAVPAYHRDTARA